MKIVSLEWFEQSLERGMVLDEAFYNPTIPVEQRGQGAWDRREFSSPAPGKRAREAEASQALNPFRRKLRRSASTRMGSQSAELWAGITAVSLDRQREDGDDWTEELRDGQDTPHEHTSASHLQDSIIPEHTAPTDVDSAQGARLTALPSLPSKADIAHGIFEGRVVFPYGFDDEKVVWYCKNLDLSDRSIRPIFYGSISKTRVRAFLEVPDSTISRRMTSDVGFL
jgi:DNA replication regulator DPB11